MRPCPSRIGDTVSEIWLWFVVALPYGFIMFDTFAAANAGEDVRLFVEEVRRDQDRDGPADSFFGGIAEEMFGTAVPACYDAVEILADDGIPEDSTIAARCSAPARRACVP